MLDSVTGASRNVVDEDECPASFQRVIKRLLSRRRYDVFYANYLKVTPECLRAFRGLKIVDLHDIQTNRIRNDVAPKLAPRAAKRLLTSYQRSERETMAIYDVLVAISDVERAELATWFNGAPRIELLPITFDAAKRTRPTKGRSWGCLFVGSRSDANVRSLLWFLDRILPSVLRELPKLKMLIQGHVCRNVQVRQILAENPTLKKAVRLQEYVEHLEEVYSAAQVVVCPVVSGTGMKVKVIEALALGKAVVGTPIAFEGIHVTHGTHACIAEDEQGFANEIIELLSDPDKRSALERNATSFVTQYHLHRVAQDFFGELLNGAAR